MAECILNAEFTHKLYSKVRAIIKGYMQEKNQLHTASRQIIRLPLV